jgi:hypothetical protein
MMRAGDLFGDSVNIAARLQTLAAPGAVCISGATYDQVRKVLPMTFMDLGVQQVKNIQEPEKENYTHHSLDGFRVEGRSIVPRFENRFENHLLLTRLRRTCSRCCGFACHAPSCDLCRTRLGRLLAIITATVSICPGVVLACSLPDAFPNVWFL